MSLSTWSDVKKDIFNCGRRLQEKICAIDLIEKSLV